MQLKSKVDVLLGLQWGDEGKGKVVDVLTPHYDVIARFHNLAGEADRKRTEQSFFVPKEEIVSNDYDLSINKYKQTEYKPVEYPPTSEILAELRKLEAEIKVEMDGLEKLLNQ